MTTGLPQRHTTSSDRSKKTSASPFSIIIFLDQVLCFLDPHPGELTTIGVHPSCVEPVLIDRLLGLLDLLYPRPWLYPIFQPARPLALAIALCIDYWDRLDGTDHVRVQTKGRHGLFVDRMSLSDIQSSGASDGTLVTRPVPTSGLQKEAGSIGMLRWTTGAMHIFPTRSLPCIVPSKERPSF